MTSIRRATALVLIGLIAIAPLGAVGKRKAQYAGGTVASLKDGAEGTFDTRDEHILRFDARKRGSLEIPYKAITGLEYGQNASRRVAMAILISPWALFSKKRKHYLTVEYTDAEGKDQAAVFELGKAIIRTTLTIVSTRSGHEITYQDAEAERAGRGL